MVSEEIALGSGKSLESHLKLANPLTDDRIYLRRSLVPSLIETIEANPLRRSLSVFEIANVYHPHKDDLPSEELHLTMVSTKPYRKVRGHLENLLSQAFLSHTKVDQEGNISAVGNGKRRKIGVVSTSRKLVSIDIKMSDLLAAAQTHPTYKAIPKTSPVYEDFTFTLPEKTPVGEVVTTIEESHEMVSDVQLHDKYQQNYTFRVTLHDLEENLDAARVAPLRKKIAAAVTKKHKAKLVGNA